MKIHIFGLGLPSPMLLSSALLPPPAATHFDGTLIFVYFFSMFISILSILHRFGRETGHFCAVGEMRAKICRFHRKKQKLCSCNRYLFGACIYTLHVGNETDHGNEHRKTKIEEEIFIRIAS